MMCWPGWGNGADGGDAAGNDGGECGDALQLA
jgi:hypothetical protein